MSSHQGGFTLIETLIVASIVLIIIPISFMKLASLSDDQKVRYFVEELLDTLQEAQMMAIADEETIQVILDPSNHNVFIEKNSTSIKNYPFDHDIKLEKGTQNLQITFLRNGHIRSSGTLIVALGKIQYKIVLLVGQGRFYAQKQ